MLRYPKLPPELRDALFAIPPSRDGAMAYRPCDVTTADGRTIARVYIVAEQPYIERWGVWPEDDGGKSSVAIEKIREIRESPSRLPPEFANRLYAAGESGMGYHLFTVVFDDGDRRTFASGNAVDFITYPAGKGPQNVSAVLPDSDGRDPPPIYRTPDYHWCLYDDT